MRQNNKNNRGRGRGGRKGPNPLTRSYESNGPDVKVRGTAQHVADKYMTLARDALSSGDGVAAENYFQHAEHYNRIIMTAQAQQTAARKEERRQQASSENTEQPSVQPSQQPQSSDGEKPTIVSSDDPQPSIGESATNGADTSSDGNSESHAEPHKEDDVKTKPRRRRAPARPRRTKEDTVAAEANVPEASESIADNPPAFLLND